MSDQSAARESSQRREDHHVTSTRLRAPVKLMRGARRALRQDPETATTGAEATAKRRPRPFLRAAVCATWRVLYFNQAVTNTRHTLKQSTTAKKKKRKRKEKKQNIFFSFFKREITGHTAANIESLLHLYVVHL